MTQINLADLYDADRRTQDPQTTMLAESGSPMIVGERLASDDGLCHAYSEYGRDLDCRQQAGHEGNHGNPGI